MGPQERISAYGPDHELFTLGRELIYGLFLDAWQTDQTQNDQERTYEVAHLKLLFRGLGYDEKTIDAACNAGCLIMINEAGRIQSDE